MRALVAIALALGLVLAAGIPHVHPAGHGECAVCVARAGDVAHGETPDLAPQGVHEEALAVAPGLPPVAGAPLGAVPGQSPPAAP